MKVLELFAGTRSIGKAFEARGHEVFSVEWDKRFEHIDLYKDILTLSAAEVLEKFGRPDVIWASPDCTTYSIAAISHHRRLAGGGQYKPRRRLGLCEVLRPGKPSCPRPHNGTIPEVLVYRKPEGRHEENGLYERPPSVHCDLLQIRRYQNEADRHMDKSPKPGFFANVPQWRPMPRAGSSGSEDRDAGAQGLYGAVGHTQGTVRTYRRNMRERGIVTW